MAQHGQIASGMARTDAILILPESEVQNPMHRVLDAPVSADGLRDLARGAREAGEVVPHLGRRPLRETTRGPDHDDAAQRGPGPLWIAIGQQVRGRHGPGCADLHAARPPIDPAIITLDDALQVPARGIREEGLDIRSEPLLVVLEGEHVE